jgi:hypothetical protein
MKNTTWKIFPTQVPSVRLSTAQTIFKKIPTGIAGLKN